MGNNLKEKNHGKRVLIVFWILLTKSRKLWIRPRVIHVVLLQHCSENNHKKIVISLITSRQPQTQNELYIEYKESRRKIVGRIQTNKPT